MTSEDRVHNATMIANQAAYNDEQRRTRAAEAQVEATLAVAEAIIEATATLARIREELAREARDA